VTWLGRAVVAAITAGLLAVAPASPAGASCASGPPITSAHAFTGLVTGVSNEGRTATVVTDDGRTVTVLGTTTIGPGVGASGDRTYEAGVRYEFHPTNAVPPYYDNSCTATHPIASDAPVRPVGHRPAALWTAFGVALAGLVLLVLWYPWRRAL
jgi:hypothetical protein